MLASARRMVRCAGRWRPHNRRDRAAPALGTQEGQSAGGRQPRQPPSRCSGLRKTVRPTSWPSTASTSRSPTASSSRCSARPAPARPPCCAWSPASSCRRRARCSLGGEDVTRLAPFERDVNTVFQDYALFPHMTVRENVAYGLRVAQVGRGRARRAGRRGAAHGPARRLRRPQARPALRRPAPARRAGPGPGEPAEGAAARRAARRARPQAARGDAGRAQGDPARRRHHLRLRHPRPGGGADDERPDRGVQRRAGSSRSATPAEIYEQPGDARSSPASSAPPTCSAARPPSRCSASAGTFTRPPREDPHRHATSSARGRVRDGAGGRRGTVAEVVYVGRVDPLPRGPRRRRHGWSQCSRTCRRSSTDVADCRGATVRLSWQRSTHVDRLTPTERHRNQLEDDHDETHNDGATAARVAAAALAP